MERSRKTILPDWRPHGPLLAYMHLAVTSSSSWTSCKWVYYFLSIQNTAGWLDFVLRRLSLSQVSTELTQNVTLSFSCRHIQSSSGNHQQVDRISLTNQGLELAWQPWFLHCHQLITTMDATSFRLQSGWMGWWIKSVQTLLFLRGKELGFATVKHIFTVMWIRSSTTLSEAAIIN